MGSIIEMQNVGAFSLPAPASDPVEQNAAAVDPENFSYQSTGGGIVVTIAVFYVVIYLLHLLDRKIDLKG